MPGVLVQLYKLVEIKQRNKAFIIKNKKKVDVRKLLFDELRVETNDYSLRSYISCYAPICSWRKVPVKDGSWKRYRYAFLFQQLSSFGQTDFFRKFSVSNNIT